MDPLVDGVLIGCGTVPQILDVDDDVSWCWALPAFDAYVVVVGKSSNDHMSGGVLWRGITQTYVK